MTGRGGLARRVYAASHLTGRFVLRSGAESDEYFDKFRFQADPVLLRDIADAMRVLVPESTGVLAGVELGAIPLTAVLAQATGLPARYVRKAQKTYGTMLQTEGGPVDGARVCMVEDVVSTGGQLIESCEVLRGEGAVVSDVVCVVERGGHGSRNLAAHGLTLHALFRMDELEAASRGEGT